MHINRTSSAKIFVFPPNIIQSISPQNQNRGIVIKYIPEYTKTNHAYLGSRSGKIPHVNYVVFNVRTHLSKLCENPRRTNN